MLLKTLEHILFLKFIPVLTMKILHNNIKLILNNDVYMYIMWNILWIYTYILFIQTHSLNLVVHHSLNAINNKIINR